MQPEIIFESKNFLVISKPSGLLVHPTKYQKESTLINWLIKKYPKIKFVGEKDRPGIVHRLDKDVSGLMVIAKNKNFYYYLINQFKNKKIRKRYIALVHNRAPQEEGIVDLPIGRTKKGKIVAVKYHKKIKFEKPAKTKYKIIKKFHHFTLLEVEPLTGRTNQIRVHLKAIGCPIVGDRKYSKMKDKLERIFLHAYYLGFYNLNGKWLEFFSDLPENLGSYLNNLE